MKHLNDFISFDYESFFSGKIFEVTSMKPWKEYKKLPNGKSEPTGKILGTVLECVCIQDDTDYILQEGEVFSLKYQPFSFKCSNAVANKLTKNRAVEFIPVIDSCKVYTKKFENGFTSQELSIVLSDVNIDF